MDAIKQMVLYGQTQN